MLVEEKFLDPDEAVVTINPARWIDVDGAHLLGRGSIDVERRDKAKLVVRRPECGIALDQRKTDYAGLHQAGLPAPTKCAVRPGIASGLRACRCRQAARFIQGIREHA